MLILRILAPSYTCWVFFSKFNTTSTHHVQHNIQHPTYSRTHLQYTAAQQYSCKVCCSVVLELSCFCYPPLTGTELARPREHLPTPIARCCRLPCCPTCWTYSHHCQIADENLLKRWNGELRGFCICVGWISTTGFCVVGFHVLD